MDEHHDPNHPTSEASCSQQQTSRLDSKVLSEFAGSGDEGESSAEQSVLSLSGSDVSAVASTSDGGQSLTLVRKLATLPAFISLVNYSPLDVTRKGESTAKDKKASQQKSGL
jgi:hypothetical protein